LFSFSFSRWRGSSQHLSTFTCHRVETLWPRSIIAMVSSLGIFWGLYRRYFGCWDMASLCSSSEPEVTVRNHLSLICMGGQRLMTDRTMIEVAARRWTFEDRIRDATRLSFGRATHDQIEHSLWHFPSRARKKDHVVVLLPKFVTAWDVYQTSESRASRGVWSLEMPRVAIQDGSSQSELGTGFFSRPPTRTICTLYNNRNNEWVVQSARV
jgi:hypothetical protein